MHPVLRRGLPWITLTDCSLRGRSADRPALSLTPAVRLILIKFYKMADASTSCSRRSSSSRHSIPMQEVLRMLADSDEELSDVEFESETDEESRDVLQTTETVEARSNNQDTTSVFDWHES